jgi:hypothetical protein
MVLIKEKFLQFLVEVDKRLSAYFLSRIKKRFGVVGLIFSLTKLLINK